MSQIDRISDSPSLQLEKALVAMDRLACQRILFGDNRESGAFERIEQIVVPALESIGEGWETGRLSLSQVYMAGRMSESLVDSLLPPADPKRHRDPPMAIAVLEDYHFLGSRIVYSAVRASGFELRSYGRVTVDDLARRVAEDDIAVLLLSVLMLPSALQVREVTSRLKRDGRDTKVIVGGAPFRFDPALAAEVGADAMGKSASEAIALVRHAMEGSS